MKNILIDLSKKEEVNSSKQNDDLGQLLLPGTTTSNFPKKLNESIEVLRSSSQLLDFIPIHSDNSIWKIEIIYRSKDSPHARHAKLSCLQESDYALQLSGRTLSFRNLEDALINLLKGGLFVENGNTNNSPNLPRY
jgi:hypothetical protein